MLKNMNNYNNKKKSNNPSQPRHNLEGRKTLNKRENNNNI